MLPVLPCMDLSCCRTGGAWFRRWAG